MAAQRPPNPILQDHAMSIGGTTTVHTWYALIPLICPSLLVNETNISAPSARLPLTLDTGFVALIFVLVADSSTTLVYPTV